MTNGAVGVISSSFSLWFMGVCASQCLGAGVCLRLSVFKDDEMQDRFA